MHALQTSSSQTIQALRRHGEEVDVACARAEVVECHGASQIQRLDQSRRMRVNRDEVAFYDVGDERGQPHNRVEDGKLSSQLGDAPRARLRDAPVAAVAR